ncbi:FAD-dependent monooxygenase [Ureibacillus sp. FSL K6-8385]|uniref:FAD-binding protein n=1 Tax=Ureibacillus terrenus TaxID=118246 RepID=A0A540V5L7_9BACL|nr:FAD-dependent monooxygenase [Ureibacillus terrenus]MED3661269.1 FAD-dependent monooxygenase [Ureibacillus terrenus]MED3764256.1 FAD-dependent monooxygenase [Ureibacillus terrenus]TQE92057.1 FAD-binding protein [Ureibacillus terrenus]
MSKISDVIVVGGGIGGLAAALAANDAGKSVAVFEQAPEFGEVGAGLQLAPNALEVLDRFGVKEEILKYAVLPKRLVLKDIYSAKEVASLDLGEGFQKEFGQPYIVMHRSDLHRVLLEACQKRGNIKFFTNSRIKTAEQENGSVTIITEKGDRYSADAVIGADGVKSNLRKLFVDDEPVNSEYVAYRGTIPIEEVKDHVTLDDVIMWIGPNLHLVQYPIRRGELFNLVVVFKSYDTSKEDWGTPEELFRRFEGAHPDAQYLLKFINRQFKWQMYDREPIDTWSKGNITLLGDAAHAMLQYLAQGGVQALEDAWCLREKLIECDTYEEAFKEYEKIRAPRAGMVQRSARRWGEIIHAEDEVLKMVRDALFERHKPTDYHVVDFLYGIFKKEKEVSGVN